MKLLLSKSSNEETSVGFIVDNDKMVIDNRIKSQLNKLIVKLNRKFPTLFPLNDLNSYKMINCEEALNTLNLKVFICFGNEAFYIINKIVKNKNQNVKIIKINPFNYTSLTRRARINTNNEKFRVRTNYQLLDAYREIEKELIKEYQ